MSIQAFRRHTQAKPMKDSLQRFLFEDANVRGELVHLDAAWHEVLQRSEYPEPVRDLLGEMMAAAVLLSATIKFEGSMTLQVQGGGPVSLMVVECTHQYALRGLAHWDEEALGEAGDGLEALLGDGRLAITVDPGAGRERYQGIVALEGSSLSEALDAYLARSEQLDTRLWLAADGASAAGLLLQRLPGEQPDADAWNRVTRLGETVTDRELIDLPAGEVMHRLFHEEDVRVFESQAVSFRCSCSRERVANMLRSLGPEEVHDVLEEQGAVEVACEFCNQRYDFDRVDVEQLFAGADQPHVPRTRH